MIVKKIKADNLGSIGGETNGLFVMFAFFLPDTDTSPHFHPDQYIRSSIPSWSSLEYSPGVLGSPGYQAVKTPLHGAQ
jgi:hypothetical protein